VFNDAQGRSDARARLDNPIQLTRTLGSYSVDELVVSFSKQALATRCWHASSGSKTRLFPVPYFDLTDSVPIVMWVL
jgi:hypothetical protein